VIEPLLRRVPEARSTRGLDRLRQARKLLRGDHDDPIQRHLAWARLTNDELVSELLGTQRADEAIDRIRRMYERAPADVAGSLHRSIAPSLHRSIAPSLDLERILLADLAIGLPADMLHKVDTASMFHSLEVRVPLLSKGLVDFVTGLPVEYRISGRTGKRILRDAFRDVMPAPILNRSKMGFEVPVGEFLRRELRDMFYDVVTPDALQGLGVNPRPVGRLYDEHLRRRRDHADLLWALLVLCGWGRRQNARITVSG
jgi:asparagine synthase (glutamine-hydrolysing)